MSTELTKSEKEAATVFFKVIEELTPRQQVLLTLSLMRFNNLLTATSQFAKFAMRHKDFTLGNPKAQELFKEYEAIMEGANVKE